MARLRLLVLPAVAAALAAPAALAGPIQAQLTLAAGPLSLRQPAATLEPGQALTARLLVTDARGSGAGWTLALWQAPRAPIVAISVRCDQSACTLPKALTTPTGRLVLRAAHDSGMGRLLVTVRFAAPAPTSRPQRLRFTVS